MVMRNQLWLEYTVWGGGGWATFSAMNGRWSDQLKYHIDIKFDKEFSLLVWRIDWPTAELKSANIKL